MKSLMKASLKPAMPANRARHWAQINEVTFVSGMRLLFWIYRILGAWPFRAVLYPVLLWYLATKPIARRASIDYLRRLRAFDAASDMKSGTWSVLCHFGAFADCILDKMLLWGKLFDTSNTFSYGHAQLASRIAEKRGGLMICSHLGNLELCRMLAKQQAGLKLTVLVHTKHARAFNQLLAQLDPDSQLNLMQVTEISPATAMLLAEKIERGEFIVIAGDRIPVAQKPRVAIARFLGAPAAFPVGPYILASLLQCPIYLLFSIRTGRMSEIHCELLRESFRLPRKGRDEALAVLVTEYAARLEHFCSRAPFQWFNFYDFWHLPMDLSDAPR